MLLVVGSPSLRRAALDALAARASRPMPTTSARTAARSSSATACCVRSARSRRAATSCGSGTRPSSTPAAGSSRPACACSRPWRAPLAAAHREIAPDEAAAGGLALRYVTNAPAQPGETPRDALARRLADTAEKEVWNGSTVIGPHRDDLAFDLGGRDLAGFASRGQQRTAILAFKLAELDLLTELDGRPPLLLLDDVFSELDPERRSHLVRRIAGLPQAFVTTTTPDDLDPALLGSPTAGRCSAGAAGAELRRPTARARAADRATTPRRRPMRRIGDLHPGCRRALGLEDELRLARAIATFEAIVAERVPGRGRRVPRRPPRGVRDRRRGRRADRRARSCGCGRASCWRPSRRPRAASAIRDLRVHVRRGGPRV